MGNRLRSTPILPILNKHMMHPEVTLQQVYEMRDFMSACNDYIELVTEEMVNLTTYSPVTSEPQAIMETMLRSNQHHPIVADLHEAVGSLRAFMESAGGDYANGVEDGMQRAADMIETILKRHEVK